MTNYTTIAGDMWDLIAYKTLGNEQHMDLLIKHNLEYMSVYIFPAGVVLSIPDPGPEYSPTLPPWKRQGVSK